MRRLITRLLPAVVVGAAFCGPMAHRAEAATPEVAVVQGLTMAVQMDWNATSGAWSMGPEVSCATSQPSLYCYVAGSGTFSTSACGTGTFTGTILYSGAGGFSASSTVTLVMIAGAVQGSAVMTGPNMHGTFSVEPGNLMFPNPNDPTLGACETHLVLAGTVEVD